MTLAVMTRATRGHTGRSIESTLPTILIYGAILVAACARMAAPVFPGAYFETLCVAAVAWMAAFGGFVASYGPTLLQPRRAG